MVFRKGTQEDIPAICRIYDATHTLEEQGGSSIGWIRGIYPTEETARQSIDRGDMFVAEEAGQIVGTAIINQTQVDVYENAPWRYPAADDEVMVLHTLVIDPAQARRGYGRKFVEFYEAYALEQGCPFLRMDTGEINRAARALYKRLGYREVGLVQAVFNGIPGMKLVCLEKKIGGEET